jgi:putative Holliday junction resolvase
MKRILGLDVGDNRLGIAVSDELGWTAQSLPVRQRASLAADLAYLRDLCMRYDIMAIVVGLPKNMNGSLGPQAQKTLAFIDRLRQACSVPVTAWDERLTSRAAERALLETNTSRRRRKAIQDRVAAQFILQSYLDWRQRQTSPLEVPTERFPVLDEGFPPENHTAQNQGEDMRQPDAHE